MESELPAVEWRDLDETDYAHIDATRAWGAFVGSDLIFLVTRGTGEPDEIADPERVDEFDRDSLFSTWVVLTAEEDGFAGLEPLDSYKSLAEARNSLKSDLEQWRQGHGSPGSERATEAGHID